MKELIKVAERLYKNIDETQSHLIKARLDKDRIREHLELIGLETIVFDAKQLLKCIIDRKDNIVDLSEVWHDTNILPSENKGIIYLTKKGKIGVIKAIKSNKWDWYVADKYSIIKWAYVDDLLPKGGEEWNTTK